MIVPLVLLSLGPCAEVAACSVRLKATPEALIQARAAVARLRLKEAPANAPIAPIDLKVLKGDVAFQFEVEPLGTQWVVRALSLHRPASLFGRAVVTPQQLPKPAQRAKALELALHSAMAAAMDDLSAQLAERAGQGKRTLKLSVRVNGLPLAARRQVIEGYFPCLKGQFDALGAVTEPAEVAGYLEDSVDYVPAKDEPRDSLQWQTDRLRMLSLGLKAVCALPAGVSARFAADSLNRGVLIELR